jgi:hypothetical protein
MDDEFDEYAAMLAFWDDIAHDVVEMRPVLRTHARVLGLEGTPGAILEPPVPDDAHVGTDEPHLLITICSDALGIATLTMVPERLVDDRLRWALETIRGRTFAGGADLSREQWDAAVLVMSALPWEMRDVDALARWAHDDGSSLATEEIARYWNRWSGCHVMAWTDLAHTTTAVYAIRRAM